jgi:uncharacterized membrane protein
MSLLDFFAAVVVVGVPLAIIFLLKTVQDLRQRMSEMESEMARMRREINQPRGAAPVAAGESEAAAPRIAEPLQQSREPVEPVDLTHFVFVPAELPPIVPPPPPVASPRAEPTFANGNWERFLGVKLFAWVGGLALFMGVSFFLKYSFEQNLIPPWIRVAIGLVLGVGLIVGGSFVRRRQYLVTAQTLVATGLVVLYAVSFAARSLYHLINTPTLFLAMCGVTIAAFVLAIRLDAKVVAILGVLGGFLTPHLVGGTRPNPFVLFGYIVFLNTGLFTIGRRQGWRVLLPLGAGATIVSEIIWVFAVLSPSNALGTLIMLAVLNALFVAAFYLDAEPVEEKILPPIAHALAVLFAGFGFLALDISLPPALIVAAIFLGNLALIALLVRSFSQLALGCGWIGSAVLILAWVSKSGAVAPPAWLFGACLFHGVLNLALPLWLAERNGNPTFPRWPSLPAAAPFLLMTVVITFLPQSGPALPLAFLAALAGLVVYLSIRARDYQLLAVALGGSVLAQYGWHVVHFKIGVAGSSGAWHLWFFLAFTAVPFMARRWIAQGEWLPWRVSAAAGPLHFYLIHQSAEALAPGFQYPGLLPAILAIPAFCALWMLRRTSNLQERMRYTAIYGASVLFFVTVVFPIQFDREWLTIGWALEGAALLWLYRRVPAPWLPRLATGLLLVAFVRLALNPHVLGYYQRGGPPILNWYLYTYGLVAGAFFLAARLARDERLFETPLRAVFGACGGILLFLLMNIEIADFFSTAEFLVFEFSGNFARDMTYSLAWALFALVLVGLGAARDARAVRIAGMGLMVVTLLKLFFHDLSRLDQLYRIGAFIGVAIILIVASWLYQRFLAKAKPAAQR